MKKLILCLLTMFMVGLTTEVQAQNSKVPTFKEVSDSYFDTNPPLSKYGIKLLKEDLHEYDGDEVGDIFVGRNAKIINKDYENKIVPTSDHAIVIVSGQGAEVSTLDIYFSNEDDYNTFLETCPEKVDMELGNWHITQKGKEGNLYKVSFDDQSNDSDW